jgi:tetratricopeptide (TPR) repeat protein
MKYCLLLLLFVLTGWPEAAKAQSSTAEQTFKRAMQNMSAGSYAKAEAEFNEVRRSDPDNPSVLINLGVLYVRTHRFTEAIDSYKKALRIVPSQEALQLNLGLAYLKQEKYAEALPYFAHLHSLHADNSQVITLLSTCLTYTGQPKDAIALLVPLTGAGSQDRGALYILGIAYTRADQPGQAREVLGRVFAEAPPSQQSFLLGEAYLDATDFPSAVQAFQATLAQVPDFAGVHRELGRAYLGMHQNDKAEQELRLAIKADPHDGSALYSLGALLVQLSRWGDGCSLLEQAQTVAPNSWATAFYLGKAKFELHDTTAAETQLRLAAQLNPDEAGAPYLLARIVRAQGHTEEAAKLMERVAALHATALDAEKNAVDRANREKPSALGQ